MRRVAAAGVIRDGSFARTASKMGSTHPACTTGPTIRQRGPVRTARTGTYRITKALTLVPGGSPMIPGAPRTPGRLRKLVRPPAGRITNQTLFVALLLVFGTGVATVAIGSASGRWAAIAHGIAGLVILLLVPWKSRVVRGGLRRGRPTRWASLLLAALIVITFGAGVGYAGGLVRLIAGRPG